MKAKVASLSPRTALVLAIAAVLLYAVVAWFAVVAPKRSEASRLGEELAAAELRLVEAKVAGNRPSGAAAPVSDVLKLAKAMPSSADQPGLVLELFRIAEVSGVTLRSVTPSAPMQGAGGATMVPVAVTVSGGYFEIIRFLHRTRSLVTVRRGNLSATGRLFTVQSVELVESLTEGFPMLDAAITLNAYVYDGPIAPPPKPAESPDELQPTGGTAAAGRTG